MKTKLLCSLLGLFTLTFGLVGCDDPTTSSGGTSEGPNTSESGGGSSTEEPSTIQSITITEEYQNYQVGVGEIIYISNAMYEIHPSGLPSSQRRVELSLVDGEEYFEANDDEFTAIAPGVGTFRITSRVNEEIYADFNVTVIETFFARTDGFASVDLTHENDENNPYVTTRGVTTDLMVAGIDSTKWYAETTINIQEVTSSEKFPKVGIFSRASDGSLNRTFFFMNAEIGDSGNDQWQNFGVCEVQGQDGWAWNPGISNDEARHVDNCYVHDSVLTYNTEFKMGLARSGLRYYMYVNDVYVGEFDILPTLIGADQNSNIGFFQFNSTVVFSNYSATDDAAEVDARIDAISEHKVVESWAAD